MASEKRLGREWVNASVSWGTMQDVDLIPKLESVLDEAGVAYTRPPAVEKLMADEDALTDAERDEVSWYLAEDLWEAMDDIAPEGCYFGASEGDGADFGFWRTSEDLTCPECGAEFDEEGGFEAADNVVCCSDDCAARHEVAEGLREPFEPDEGDVVTEDCRKFYSYTSGRLVFVAPNDDWRSAARAWMDRENFFPNFWIISCHDDAHLLSVAEEPK